MQAKDNTEAISHALTLQIAEESEAEEGAN